MSRSRSEASSSALVGTTRVGRDPRAVARTLKRGQVAIVDCVDLDAGAAEALARHAPACVVNASPSLTGRLVMRGAERLLALGVPLFDAGDRAVVAVPDGAACTIARGEDGAATFTSDGFDVTLTEVTADAVEERLAQARAGSALRVPELAAGALDLVRRDGPALVDGGAVRGLDLDLEGRDVLVVGAGPGFESQLAASRRAIKDLKMAVIATGDAADAVAAKHRIDVVVGPFEGVSDEVLARASRVVVHGESHAVAATRLGSLGVRYVSSESRLASEDLAVAIAASGGARTIVTVGLEASVTELIDSPKGASALLARMAAGSAWIDARTLVRVHRSRWTRLQGWLLVLVAAGALAGALSLHPSVRDAVSSLVGGS